MAFAKNEYLSEHRLPEMLDDLLGKMLVVRPPRPLMFMINECSIAEQDRRRETAGMEEGLSGFPDLKGCNNHMAHCLTEAIYRELWNLCTPYGGTLDDAIQIGIDVKDHVFDSACGVAATDAKTYDIFKPLMSLVIARQHPGITPNFRHEVALANTLDIPESYPTPPYLEACKGFYVTGVRSLQDTPFPYKIHRKERRILTAAVRQALQRQTVVRGTCSEGGDITNQRPFADFPPCDSDNVMECIEDWIRHPPTLDTEHDRKLNIRRDWPDGRLVWESENDGCPITVWANMHEHLHLRACGDYKRFVHTVTKVLLLGQALEQELKKFDCAIESNEELGAVVSNPACLGTGFTFGVVMRLDKLIRHRWFDKLLSALKLTAHPLQQIVGKPYFGTTLSDAPAGNPTFSASTEFITHDRPVYVAVETTLTMGVTVREVVRATTVAVEQMSELEELLQRGQTIDSSIEKMT